MAPFTTEFKKVDDDEMAFIGEFDTRSGRPDGFVRCINQSGNIYEGYITSDLKINGWCISYNGQSNEILIGWYKNNERNGNWMKLNGSNL